MTFVFQEPETAGLLDALNDCSKDAESGGGVFAYATKGGVEAVFGLPNIAAMLAAGRLFHLIVGIDAITNTEALLCLSEKAAKYKKSLKAQVFLHDQAPCTFHPKFSWFTKKDEVRLITGSGNLTERGLGKRPGGQSANWEAFGVQSLSGKDGSTAAKGISGWLEAQVAAGTLCSLNDSRVVEKAMANARVRYTSPKPKAKPKLQPKGQAVVVAAADADVDSTAVLIRELPRTRGGQGDIGQTAHRQFFGHAGTDKDIFMQYVELDDTPHQIKKVWLFYNEASNNYRLELPESKGNYEVGKNDERMVLVAVKLDPRSFRYTILRPEADKSDYDKVGSLLGPMKKAGRRLMRERFASPDELYAAWNEVPSNLLPLHLPTAEP